MFEIFHLKDINVERYFFVIGTKWSSDFDTIEQLVDVGLDDPDIRVNPRLSGLTIEEFTEGLTLYGEVLTHIASTPTLEELEEIHPELFI